MKRIFAVLLVLVLLFGICHAEESYEDPVYMTVLASRLNGRARPSKKSFVEAFYDKGDYVKAYGWSDNHHWIEIAGGETGTVWVWWEYLTERTDEFPVWNGYGSKVKIRKEPFGKVIGYLKKDAEVYIDQVVFGWGHCSKGWVDLSYLTEED